MVREGDVVLFIPMHALPVPRGKMRMWDVGVVRKVVGEEYLEVEDCCRKREVVFARNVKVLKKRGEYCNV